MGNKEFMSRLIRADEVIAKGLEGAKGKKLAKLITAQQIVRGAIKGAEDQVKPGTPGTPGEVGVGKGSKRASRGGRP